MAGIFGVKLGANGTAKRFRGVVDAIISTLSDGVMVLATESVAKGKLK